MLLLAVAPEQRPFQILVLGAGEGANSTYWFEGRGGEGDNLGGGSDHESRGGWRPEKYVTAVATVSHGAA